VGETLDDAAILRVRPEEVESEAGAAAGIDEIVRGGS
jgi:hypothetical protein